MASLSVSSDPSYPDHCLNCEPTGPWLPSEAIVTTFEMALRTVQRLWTASGQHCQRSKKQKSRQAHLDLGEVRMDEVRHKMQGIVL